MHAPGSSSPGVRIADPQPQTASVNNTPSAVIVVHDTSSASMGQNEKLWSQDRRVSQCESPPPLLSALQSGQSDIAPIYKFVLTGGPCAGKTTSLDRLSTYFRYAVRVVATMRPVWQQVVVPMRSFGADAGMCGCIL